MPKRSRNSSSSGSVPGRKKARCGRKPKVTKMMYSKEYIDSNDYLNYNILTHTHPDRVLQFLDTVYGCVCHTSMIHVTVFVSHKELPIASAPLRYTVRGQMHTSRYDRHVKRVGESYSVLFLPVELQVAIKKCRHKFLVALASIDTIGRGITHSNVVIFNTHDKVITWFEPFGSDSTIGDAGISMADVLKKKVNYTRVVKPIDYCPKMTGPQHHEQWKYDNKDSFCVMFSTLFVVYTLDYPEATPSQIISMMYQGRDKDIYRRRSLSEGARTNLAKEIRIFTNVFVHFQDRINVF
jgi:hypothetical protein